jgi:hypothetical protein
MGYVMYMGMVSSPDLGWQIVHGSVPRGEPRRIDVFQEKGGKRDHSKQKE